MAKLPIDTIRSIAASYGFFEVQFNQRSRVIAFRRIDGRVRVNVSYTTGTVAICCKGKGQIFRKHQDIGLVETLFRDLRLSSKGHHYYPQQQDPQFHPSGEGYGGQGKRLPPPNARARGSGGGLPEKDVTAPPKRDMSAYLLYQNAMRQQFQPENPGMTSGQLANYHTSKEKGTWEAGAAQDRDRYDAEIASYCVPPHGAHTRPTTTSSVVWAPPGGYAVALQQQQRPAGVSWSPMVQELEHEKIRDQRVLLRRQHRTIKFLKCEVMNLKRKVHQLKHLCARSGGGHSTNGCERFGHNQEGHHQDHHHQLNTKEPCVKPILNEDHGAVDGDTGQQEAAPAVMMVRSPQQALNLKFQLAEKEGKVIHLEE